MKKVFKAALAVVAVVILACAFAGCTANVSGKTYVYSEVKMSVPSDASDVEKGIADIAKGATEAIYKNAKFTFGEDGNVTGYAVGTWKQEGKTVTVTGAPGYTFTVKGSKLELGGKEGNYEFVVVFVKE